MVSLSLSFFLLLLSFLKFAKCIKALNVFNIDLTSQSMDIERNLCLFLGVPCLFGCTICCQYFLCTCVTAQLNTMCDLYRTTLCCYFTVVLWLYMLMQLILNLALCWSFIVTRFSVIPVVWLFIDSYSTLTDHHP